MNAYKEEGQEDECWLVWLATDSKYKAVHSESFQAPMLPVIRT